MLFTISVEELRFGCCHILVVDDIVTDIGVLRLERTRSVPTFEDLFHVNDLCSVQSVHGVLAACNLIVPGKISIKIEFRFASIVVRFSLTN